MRQQGADVRCSKTGERAPPCRLYLDNDEGSMGYLEVQRCSKNKTP